MKIENARNIKIGLCLDQISSKFNIEKETLDLYYRTFQKRGLYLLEQPTGAGKSLLISILSLIYASIGKKVFIFCRTHKQLEEYFNRLYMLKKLCSEDLIVIPILGKEFTCPYGDLYLENSSYVFCKNRENGRKCIDFNNIKKLGMKKLIELSTSSFSIYDIIENLLMAGACPYYSFTSLSNKGNIILSTYYYLFHGLPNLLPSPYTYMVFIDEGHNLFEYIIESNVQRIDINDILYSFNYSTTKELSELKDLLHNYYKGNLHDLNKLVGAIERVYYGILTNRIVIKNPEIINILNKLSILLKEKSLIRLSNGSLDIIQPTNKKFIENLINSSISTVVMSATLSPKEYFKHLFKIMNIKLPIYEIETPYLYEPIKDLEVTFFLSREISSKYPEREKNIIRKISEYAINNLAKNSYHTFIFVPSQQLGKEFYDTLEEMVLISNYRRNLEKPIRIMFLSDVLPNLNFDKLMHENHLIGILTQRGVLSEGINIFRKYDFNANLIFYGLSIKPFDKTKSDYIKRFFKLKRREEIYKLGYLMPAMIFFIQSLGRFMGRKRKLTISVFERRFIDLIFSEFVPQWFKKLIENNKVVIINDYDDVDRLKQK